QARIAEVEAVGVALPMRHRIQRAVEPIAPAVIRADEAGQRAALPGAHHGAAMRAPVDQRMDALPVAHYQHVLAGDPGTVEIAGVGDLAVVRQEYPGAAEDAVHI